MGKYDNGVSYPRVPDDFYPSPEWVIDALCEHVDLTGRWVWECSCGDGRMAEAIKRAGARAVYATDIVDRGYAGLSELLDFTSLRIPKVMDINPVIITNPPMSERGKKDGRLAMKFVEVAAPGILAVDESALKGPAEYRMQFARELRNAGAPERALRYGYALVREAPDNPQVALGFAFLILGDRGDNIIPSVAAAREDAWVRIRSSDDGSAAFAIDEGGSFFGIDVRPPGHPSAKAIEGLQAGAMFEVQRRDRECGHMSCRAAPWHVACIGRGKARAVRVRLQGLNCHILSLRPRAGTLHVPAIFRGSLWEMN